MGATVGQLDIQVQVALAKMEAQFGDMEKKVRATTTTMRRHFANSNAESRREFGKLSEGVGEHMSKIERQVEHAANHMIGKFTGISNLGRLGLAGGILIGAERFGEAIAAYAEKTRDLDPASDRMARHIERAKALFETLKEGAVKLGFTSLSGYMLAGEEIGRKVAITNLGGNEATFNRRQAIADAADAQERRRDLLFKANPPEKVDALRERSREIQRQIDFDKLSNAERITRIRADTISLRTQEKSLMSKHEVIKAAEIHNKLLERRKELEETIHTAGSKFQEIAHEHQRAFDEEFAKGQAQNSARVARLFSEAEKMRERFDPKEKYWAERSQIDDFEKKGLINKSVADRARQDLLPKWHDARSMDISVDRFTRVGMGDGRYRDYQQKSAEALTQIHSLLERFLTSGPITVGFSS